MIFLGWDLNHMRIYTTLFSYCSLPLEGGPIRPDVQKETGSLIAATNDQNSEKDKDPVVYGSGNPKRRQDNLLA